MLRVRRFLLLLLAIVVHEAQAVRVEGFVREGSTRLPLRGAVVTLERPDAAPMQVVTRIDGHYRFEVRAGERAVIRFAAEGQVSRYVVFDASEVPSEWTDALEASLDMRLFPPMEGLDSALVAAPAGMCSWDQGQETMVWDTERSAPVTEKWNALAEAHLAAHPERRPTQLQHWMAKAFDLVIEWAFFVSFALAWLLYVVLHRVVGGLATGARLWLLVAVLLGAVLLMVDLGREVGPLRFLAFFGLLSALISVGLLATDLLVGRAAFERSRDTDPEPFVGEEMMDGPAGGSVRSRFAGWAPLVGFFGSALAVSLEGIHGLDNTLEVWGLAGMGAASGLALAALVAWSRAPRMVRGHLRFVLLAGGVWWFALPMVGVAAASFLNRSFLEGQEHCKVWPVEEVTRSRRRINVRVSWAGERERLEMPRAIKEQLTTLDSLRCCMRMGLLGHPYVVRVEPILTGDHPR